MKKARNVKARKIYVACIKKTSNYFYYVGYIHTRNGLTLIAPDSKEETEYFAMHYSPANTGIPPYTFKVHYTENWKWLNDELCTALRKMGLYGTFEINQLSGYYSAVQYVEVRK